MEDIVKMYEAIFYRKSVRKYKPDPLPMERLFELQRLAEGLEPLLPNIPTAIEVLSGEKVKGKYVVPAPHYLCIYTKEDLPGSRENAGYLLEQMALLLAADGLGCCWLGIAKPPKEALQSRGLDYMVMLAFGEPEGDGVRKDIGQFRRKPIEAITDVDACKELLEAVRLAPSAMNSQPWYITGRPGNLLFTRTDLPVLKRRFMTPMNRLDMGIALAHFRLATACSGTPIRISLDPAQNTAAEKLDVPEGTLFSARVTW